MLWLSSFWRDTGWHSALCHNNNILHCMMPFWAMWDSSSPIALANGKLIEICLRDFMGWSCYYLPFKFVLSSSPLHCHDSIKQGDIWQHLSIYHNHIFNLLLHSNFDWLSGTQMYQGRGCIRTVTCPLSFCKLCVFSYCIICWIYAFPWKDQGNLNADFHSFFSFSAKDSSL